MEAKVRPPHHTDVRVQYRQAIKSRRKKKMLVTIGVILVILILVFLIARERKEFSPFGIPGEAPGKIVGISPTQPGLSPSPNKKVLIQDTATKTQIWRVSNTPGITTHAYYDISPWSPDGSRIAWSTQTGPFASSMYVTDGSTGESRLVAKSNYVAFEAVAYPVWVSNTVLYFLGGTPGDNLNIYAVDISSGETWQVTKHSGLAWLNGIHLNANKTKMAYYYFPSRTESLRFAVATIEGDLIREVAQNPDGDRGMFHSKWSPTDPNKLMYYNQAGAPKKLWLLDTITFTSTFLTTFSDHPMWCPDGTCIVLNDYIGDPRKRNSRVHIIEGDGSNKRMVANGGINTFHAHSTMSPDGSKIIIDPRFDPTWTNSILLLDVKTGTIEPLVTNAWANTDASIGQRGDRYFQLHAHPVWSPDGSAILYAARACKTCADDSDVYVAYVE